jgi:AFG3 family protein
MDQKKPAPKKEINTGEEMKRKLSSPSYWFYFILLLLIFIFYFLRGASSAKEITWQQFKQEMLDEHDVAKINVINGEIAEVYLKPESLKKEKFRNATPKTLTGKSGPHYFFSIGSVEAFERKLDEAQKEFPENEKIPVTYTK